MIARDMAYFYWFLSTTILIFASACTLHYWNQATVFQSTNHSRQKKTGRDLERAVVVLEVMGVDERMFWDISRGGVFFALSVVTSCHSRSYFPLRNETNRGVKVGQDSRAGPRPKN